MYKDYITGVLTISNCIFMNLLMIITKTPQSLVLACMSNKSAIYLLAKDMLPNLLN